MYRAYRWSMVSALVLVLSACGGVQAQSPGSVAPTALLGQIEAGRAPVILDVRTPEEYAAGHVPGAINIDFRQVAERLDEIPGSRSEPVVVYCQRGVRAQRAENALRAAGFTTVLHLEGQMAGWQADGLPVAKP